MSSERYYWDRKEWWEVLIVVDGKGAKEYLYVYLKVLGAEYLLGGIGEEVRFARSVNFWIIVP